MTCNRYAIRVVSACGRWVGRTADCCWGSKRTLGEQQHRGTRLEDAPKRRVPIEPIEKIRSRVGNFQYVRRSNLERNARTHTFTQWHRQVNDICTEVFFMLKDQVFIYLLVRSVVGCNRFDTLVWGSKEHRLHMAYRQWVIGEQPTLSQRTISNTPRERDRASGIGWKKRGTLNSLVTDQRQMILASWRTAGFYLRNVRCAGNRK